MKLTLSSFSLIIFAESWGRCSFENSPGGGGVIEPSGLTSASATMVTHNGAGAFQANMFWHSSSLPPLPTSGPCPSNHPLLESAAKSGSEKILLK